MPTATAGEKSPFASLIEGWESFPAHVRAFIEKYSPAAQKTQQETGIPVSVTLAQAALESGWGQSELTQKAYNFFGVKATDNWDGGVYWGVTKEYRNGQYETEVAAFRKYDNPADSFLDRAKLLQNERYADAMKYANDPLRMVEELEASGYATDPKYGEKLGNIMSSYGLLALDDMEPIEDEDSNNGGLWGLPDWLDWTSLPGIGKKGWEAIQGEDIWDKTRDSWDDTTEDIRENIQDGISGIGESIAGGLRQAGIGLTMGVVYIVLFVVVVYLFMQVIPKGGTA